MTMKQHLLLILHLLPLPLSILCLYKTHLHAWTALPAIRRKALMGYLLLLCCCIWMTPPERSMMMTLLPLRPHTWLIITSCQQARARGRKNDQESSCGTMPSLSCRNMKAMPRQQSRKWKHPSSTLTATSLLPWLKWSLPCQGLRSTPAKRWGH